MARAALAALALAVCARADQYGAGAMPQYGAADYERDYYARSPDAPAPLNYKYQEDPNGETEKPAKFTEEVDRWRKSSGRVQRRSDQEDTDEDLELESKALESEMRSGRRRHKRKGRGRRDESRHEQSAEALRRAPLVPPGDRPARAGSHHDHYLDSIDYRDDADGNKYLEDNERFPFREPTEKVRKPRQRIFAPPPLKSTTVKSSGVIIDEEEEKIGPIKDEFKEDSEYSSDEEQVRAGGAGHSWPAPAGRRPVPRGSDPETGPDNEDAMRERRPSKPAGSYPEYNEYSNMKSIENIKKKLPTLLRRPIETTTTQRARRLFSAGRTQLWPERRAGALSGFPPEIQLQPSAVPPSRSPEPPSRSPEPTPKLHASPSTKSIVTPTRATVPAPKTNNYSPVAFVPAVNGSELSMADKSRLSILNKALKKQNAWKDAGKKPPVLLQVTTPQVPTVVMVAPDNGDPWQRAREVSGDTPNMLEKVKRLMRQKLIASAKNIRNITDNWDETVCDYIDVGMLARLPDAAPRPPAPLPLLAGACTLCLAHVL